MGARPRAVEFLDGRNGDRRLRVSWHGIHRKAILSQWRDGVCVATTPLQLEELPRLIEFLAEVLDEALTTEESTLPPAVYRRAPTPSLSSSVGSVPESRR